MIKKVFFLFSLLLLSPFLLFSQQSKIDSLLSIFKTAKEDTDIIKAHNRIGSFYEKQGYYTSALEHYIKALELVKKMKNKKGIASSFTNIGNVYDSQSNYPKALEYYFNALKMNEELENKDGIAISCGNIGNAYESLEDYSKSLEYLFKALNIGQEIGNKKRIGIQLGNIGNVYAGQGDSQKALEYYFKASNIAHELGNNNHLANWYGNIGIVYEEQREYDKALEYILKSLKIFEEIGDKEKIGICYGSIGSVYISAKKYEQAEVNLKKALTICYNLNNVECIAEFEKSFSKLDSVRGNYKGAYEHFMKYITARDSINNNENKKKQMRTEMNYEFDKKETILKEQQKKERVVAEEKSRKQKIITWSVIGGLLLVILFAGFIFRSLRITRKQKQIIEVQKTEVEKSKHIIEEKNKDITDSINYAKRIQQAKLPHRKDILSALPNSFVLFKPKDIVSGDFYYFHKNDNSVFIASADCTGHGVPGAFMSMIGSEKLDDALAHSADTSEILMHLNKGIKSSLHQTDSDESTRDGMDIALCSVDIDNCVVKYAGANRPLWIIRNGQTIVEEIKATKKAIGGFTEDSQHFDTHEIQLQQGDTFYLSTDGYADTFGGEQNKKVTTKRFKQVLIEIQHKTMKEQEQHLDSFIENWKAGTEQVDDILVIGIRL